MKIPCECGVGEGQICSLYLIHFALNPAYTTFATCEFYVLGL